MKDYLMALYYRFYKMPNQALDITGLQATLEALFLFVNLIRILCVHSELTVLFFIPFPQQLRLVMQRTIFC